VVRRCDNFRRRCFVTMNNRPTPSRTDPSSIFVPSIVVIRVGAVLDVQLVFPTADDDNDNDAAAGVEEEEDEVAIERKEFASTTWDRKLSISRFNKNILS